MFPFGQLICRARRLGANACIAEARHGGVQGRREEKRRRNCCIETPGEMTSETGRHRVFVRGQQQPGRFVEHPVGLANGTLDETERPSKGYCSQSSSLSPAARTWNPRGHWLEIGWQTSSKAFETVRAAELRTALSVPISHHTGPVPREYPPTSGPSSLIPGSSPHHLAYLNSAPSRLPTMVSHLFPVSMRSPAAAPNCQNDSCVEECQP